MSEDEDDLGGVQWECQKCNGVGCADCEYDGLVWTYVSDEVEE